MSIFCPVYSQHNCRQILSKLKLDIFSITTSHYQIKSILTPCQLKLYENVLYFTQKGDGCWCTPDYFAKQIGKSVRTVQRNFRSLIKMGLVESKITRRFDPKTRTFVTQRIYTPLKITFQKAASILKKSYILPSLDKIGQLVNQNFSTFGQKVREWLGKIWQRSAAFFVRVMSSQKRQSVVSEQRKCRIYKEYKENKILYSKEQSCLKTDEKICVDLSEPQAEAVEAVSERSTQTEVRKPKTQSSNSMKETSKLKLLGKLKNFEIREEDYQDLINTYGEDFVKCLAEKQTDFAKKKGWPKWCAKSAAWYKEKITGPWSHFIEDYFQAWLLRQPKEQRSFTQIIQEAVADVPEALLATLSPSDREALDYAIGLGYELNCYRPIPSLDPMNNEKLILRWDTITGNEDRFKTVVDMELSKIKGM